MTIILNSDFFMSIEMTKITIILISLILMFFYESYVMIYLPNYHC